MYMNHNLFNKSVIFTLLLARVLKSVKTVTLTLSVNPPSNVVPVITASPFSTKVSLPSFDTLTAFSLLEVHVILPNSGEPESVYSS